MKLATDIHLVVRKHLKRLADWIGQSDERYQARPGGLGTVNKGASETRLTIVREIQRMNKDRPIGLPDNIAKELIGFIRSMDEQKPGGLGGRRK